MSGNEIEQTEGYAAALSVPGGDDEVSTHATHDRAANQQVAGDKTHHAENLEQYDASMTWTGGRSLRTAVIGCVAMALTVVPACASASCNLPVSFSGVRVKVPSAGETGSQRITSIEVCNQGVCDSTTIGAGETEGYVQMDLSKAAVELTVTVMRGSSASAPKVVKATPRQEPPSSSGCGPSVWVATISI